MEYKSYLLFWEDLQCYFWISETQKECLCKTKQNNKTAECEQWGESSIAWITQDRGNERGLNFSKRFVILSLQLRGKKTTHFTALVYGSAKFASCNGLPNVEAFAWIIVLHKSMLLLEHMIIHDASSVGLEPNVLWARGWGLGMATDHTHADYTATHIINQ